MCEAAELNCARDCSRPKFGSLHSLLLLPLLLLLLLMMVVFARSPSQARPS